jgi:hypothetical protein
VFLCILVILAQIDTIRFLTTMMALLDTTGEATMQGPPHPDAWDACISEAEWTVGYHGSPEPGRSHGRRQRIPAEIGRIPRDNRLIWWIIPKVRTAAFGFQSSGTPVPDTLHGAELGLLQEGARTAARRRRGCRVNGARQAPPPVAAISLHLSCSWSSRRSDSERCRPIPVFQRELLDAAADAADRYTVLDVRIYTYPHRA